MRHRIPLRDSDVLSNSITDDILTSFPPLRSAILLLCHVSHSSLPGSMLSGQVNTCQPGRHVGTRRARYRHGVVHRLHRRHAALVPLRRPGSILLNVLQKLFMDSSIGTTALLRRMPLVRVVWVVIVAVLRCDIWF